MLDAIQWAFKTLVATEVFMIFAVIAFLAFSFRLVRSFFEPDSEVWQDRWAIFAILMVGLVLRVAFILWSQPLPLSDFQVYWDTANRIHQGDWTFDYISRHPGIIVLYSYVFYAFGASMSAVWGLNLFFSVNLMLVMHALGRLMLGRIPALLVMALVALLPQLITYAALAATEVPAITFSMLFLWGVLKSRTLDSSQSQWLYWAALGAMLYGAILIRSTNLLYLVLVPVVLIMTRRDTWRTWFKRYLVLAATTGVLLSGWLCHQYLVGGSPKLFWGDELWLACNVQYDRGGRYTDPGQMSFFPRVQREYEQFRQSGETRDEILYYQALGRETRKVILADPVRYLKEAFTRLRNIIWTSQTGLRWSQKGSKTMQGVPEKLIKRLATVSNVWWQILLLLAPLGFLAFRRRQVDRPGREGLLYLGLYCVAWLVFHYLLAVGSERYSFQIIPAVLLLSVGSLTYLWEGVGLFRQQRAHCKPLPPGKPA